MTDPRIVVIHLRSFRKHDLPRLYELDQSCFAQDIAYSMANLRYFLVNPRNFSCVAEREGEDLAGFIIVERTRRGGAKSGHIITIDVEPEMRRQRVGSLLLEEAQARLREEGITRLTLEVAEDNVAAQAFYRSFGFAAVGHIPNYYAGKLTARVMEKTL